jgi:hypothetical protein
MITFLCQQLNKLIFHTVEDLNIFSNEAVAVLDISCGIDTGESYRFSKYKQNKKQTP